MPIWLNHLILFYLELTIMNLNIGDLVSYKDKLYNIYFVDYQTQFYSIENAFERHFVHRVEIQLVLRNRYVI